MLGKLVGGGMSKAPIAAAIRKQTGCTVVEAHAAANAVFDTMSAVLSSDEILQLGGFGTFRVVARNGREGKNPRTGKPMSVAASKTVRFKPSPRLRNKL
jgi:DNA-binding protein HU-beta